MAATTLQAVIARFDGTTPGALTQLAGKLWFGEIPADKSLPFVGVAHGGTAPPEYNSEDDYLELDRFHFEVQDTSLVNVERIATEIKIAFDKPGSDEAHTAFPIDNAKCISCTRTSYMVRVDPETDPQGNSVYVAELDYELTVRKTKGLS